MVRRYAAESGLLLTRVFRVFGKNDGAPSLATRNGDRNSAASGCLGFAGSFDSISGGYHSWRRRKTTTTSARGGARPY